MYFQNDTCLETFKSWSNKKDDFKFGERSDKTLESMELAIDQYDAKEQK